MDLATALAKGPAKPVEDGAGDLEPAAGDLISAVNSGDPAAVAAAFKAMHTICNSYEG